MNHLGIVLNTFLLFRTLWLTLPEFGIPDSGHMQMEQKTSREEILNLEHKFKSGDKQQRH